MKILIDKYSKSGRYAKFEINHNHHSICAGVFDFQDGKTIFSKRAYHKYKSSILDLLLKHNWNDQIYTNKYWYKELAKRCQY